VSGRRSISKVVPSVALAILMLFAAAGCGSSSKQQANDVISAGQIDIKLPPGWKVDKDGKGAVRPAGESAAQGAAATPGGSGSAGGDAVPLAKEDPTTKFFGALGSFQSCLKGLNVKFIGIPDQKNPNSPTNDPNYIDALSKCAAKSNIVQALKDQQTAQDNLTPAQIKLQNKGYLAWRDCMIGRGWGIPKPQPDSKGRLFSFGAGGGSSVPAFTPPPGQDIVTSSDVSACATEAQKKVPTSSGG
jgi:hypothetical protein